mmetsp:Transcript_41290/g.101363  ORF Transcript_41290/g.101363 Transcript_41290/m.101363 type:complete len:214 (+) Transcript_41290:2301-2942(+)
MRSRSSCVVLSSYEYRICHTMSCSCLSCLARSQSSLYPSISACFTASTSVFKLKSSPVLDLSLAISGLPRAPSSSSSSSCVLGLPPALDAGLDPVAELCPVPGLELFSACSFSALIRFLITSTFASNGRTAWSPACLTGSLSFCVCGIVKTTGSLGDRKVFAAKCSVLVNSTQLKEKNCAHGPSALRLSLSPPALMCFSCKENSSPSSIMRVH